MPGNAFQLTSSLLPAESLEGESEGVPDNTTSRKAEGI